MDVHVVMEMIEAEEIIMFGDSFNPELLERPENQTNAKTQAL